MTEELEAPGDSGCDGGAGAAPQGDWSQASEAARALVARACDGLDQVVDHHVHALAVGNEVVDAFVHPRNLTPRRPYRFLKYRVFLSAAGVRDLAEADRTYMRRLLALVRALPTAARMHLLAFDRVYDEEGRIDEVNTDIYVPNGYVYALAAQHPDLFIPAASVHPHRTDAIDALERAAAAGCRLVKWLPNAMGIDPLADRHDAFYAKMRELGLALLSHAGAEFSVEGVADHELGNPLRLRRPLESGVSVIVAHCASAGRSRDLDHPGHRRVRSFALFLRLLEDPRYQGLLSGDISAVVAGNRFPGVLARLLERDELHGRLCHGSDYPVPGVKGLLPVTALHAAGFLARGEARALRELSRCNPLLFELVLKRTVKHPRSGRRFADAVFGPHPLLAPRAAVGQAPGPRHGP